MTVSLCLLWDTRAKKAMRFKELYIKRFNEMEQFIKTLVSARQEFPLLTENIKLLHENPKPYHFSNECDMINRIVIGMTAKQFREKHGIAKGESIRPFLTAEQVDRLEILQKVDVGLLVAVPDYNQRKNQLEWYYSKLCERVVCARKVKTAPSVTALEAVKAKTKRTNIV